MKLCFPYSVNTPLSYRFKRFLKEQRCYSTGRNIHTKPRLWQKAHPGRRVRKSAMKESVTQMNNVQIVREVKHNVLLHWACWKLSAGPCQPKTFCDSTVLYRSEFSINAEQFAHQLQVWEETFLTLPASYGPCSFHSTRQMLHSEGCCLLLSCSQLTKSWSTVPWF